MPRHRLVTVNNKLSVDSLLPGPSCIQCPQSSSSKSLAYLSANSSNSSQIDAANAVSFSPIIPRFACTLSYIPHCFADGHMFRKYSIMQCVAPDLVMDNRYCSFVISSNRPVSLEKYCIQMSSDSPLCMRAEIQVSVAAVERKSSTNY